MHVGREIWPAVVARGQYREKVFCGTRITKRDIIHITRASQPEEEMDHIYILMQTAGIVCETVQRQ